MFGLQFAHRLAVGADRLGREVDIGGEHGAAVHAADLAVAAMHVDHVARARLLVQRIDVLGHDGDLAVVFLLEMRQRLVGGIGRDMGGAEHPAGVVVEIEHLLLVAMPGLDGGDLLEVHPIPQPVLVAKGVDAAFLGDARAGQDDDSGGQEILMHAGQSSPVLGCDSMTIGVLFVCTGNICRSPMAEGVFRSMARQAGLEFGLHRRFGGDLWRPCRRAAVTAGHRGGGAPRLRHLRPARASGHGRRHRPLRSCAGNGPRPPGRAARLAPRELAERPARCSPTRRRRRSLWRRRSATTSARST